LTSGFKNNGFIFILFFVFLLFILVMKKIVFSLVVGAFLMNSCEEVPPFIDFSVPPEVIDTTYVTSMVPAPQHKAVLIEDITGVRCINCPQAADEIKAIVDEKTEDSVISMALYIKQLNTLTAPYPGYPNLTTDYATEMIDFLGLGTGLPTGYVDRKIYTPLTERFVQYKSWRNYVNMRLRGSTPVNIGLEKKLEGNKLTVDIKLVYTTTVSGEHKVALYLVEDGIMSKQYGGKPTEETYIHNHVLRYNFGTSLGTKLEAALTPGRTFEKKLKYEIPADFKQDKLHVVCVVTDAVTHEVINVRKIHL
jgi:hypothetical protein